MMWVGKTMVTKYFDTTNNATTAGPYLTVQPEINTTFWESDKVKMKSLGK